MEKRKFWKLSEIGVLLRLIKTISDLEYQYRIWVCHENPNIIDSYDDTTMYFIEELSPVIEDSSDVLINEEEYGLLKTLYCKIESYDLSTSRPDNDGDIVKDPEWIEITKLAKRVYDKLKKNS